MARAQSSTIIAAPVEAVWAAVRDFNGMPDWHPGIRDSVIEDGLDADVVGCVRKFHLGDGTQVRERLLALDDGRYRFSYNFETPAFPVANYVATMELIPVTNGDATYVRWRAEFDEAPADQGKYVALISDAVFGAGLAALAAKVEGTAAPAGAMRWKGQRPAKVFVSSVLHAPLSVVWRRMRDFAGMGGWHAGMTRMTILNGARPDKVSGVRDFLLGSDALEEELTYLSDAETAFHYRMLSSPMPWLGYHAGARLFPITDGDRTLAVWTADWLASAEDDLALIPAVAEGVFQTAFTTLDAQLREA